MNFSKAKTDVAPSVFIEENSFKKTWAKLIMKIMQSGAELPCEYGNMTKEIQGTIVLKESAIKQIREIDLHSKEPFGKKRTKAVSFEATAN